MLEKIFVTRPLLPSREMFNSYLDEIWESHHLTNQGPLHEKFERKVSSYLKNIPVTLTVNGHFALEEAIRVFNLSGEVITTPFSFASTTHALSICGVKPVFCDIKAEDMTIDETKIESLITDKTSAILPVHVYGHPCNVEKIQQIADKYNLKVIYDAAHAFGVNYNNASIAAWGDISMFSFHATKLFNSIEGGALAYSDVNLKQHLALLKNFGISDEEHVEMAAGNGKMNEFQAAMGLCNLDLIDDVIEKRKQLTLQYRSLLKDIDGIHMFYPDEKPDVFYNFAYFVVLIDESKYGINRDRLYDALKEKGIYSRKYFYPLIPDYDCYKEEYKGTSFPVAQQISTQVLTLPLYYDLTPEQLSYITDTIRQIHKENYNG